MTTPASETSPPLGEHAESSLLRDYLSALRRRKWFFLQAVLVVPVAAVAMSLRQEPLYRASADVLLNRNDLAAALTQTATAAYEDPVRMVETQANLARVPTVAERVLRANRLSDRTTARFLAQSSVTARRDADLLEFAVTDGSPNRAAQLATSYARQFTLYRRELDTAAIATALREVNELLQELRGRSAEDSPLFATLFEKAQQLRTLEALQTANATLVREADSAVQVQPNPVRSGIMGVVFGILLGALLVFLLEALDTRVRTADEISRQLNLPLLGRLPAPPRRVRKKSRIVMLDEPDKHSAEPFRILRTNLEFVNLDRRDRSLLVTSAVEREGKSTTVANLAVALARAGKKVSLVDLDLRRPFLDKFFGVEREPGCTDVALGHVELDEALVKIPLGAPTNGSRASRNGRESDGSLTLLPAGTRPPDPGEFVTSSQLALALAQLRSENDLVLLDSPPLLHVGDALTLSRRVDAILIVVRLGEVRQPTLKELRRLLDGVAGKAVGFVLADAEAEEGYAYGAYPYPYGHTPSRRRGFVRRRRRRARL